LSTVAVALIVFFSLLNCLQVRWGARAQTLLTALKCGLLLALIAGVAILGHPAATLVQAAGSVTGRPWYSAFGLAMIAALWAFDGWNNLPMVGEEVREPQKNLPIALALGVLAVLALYLSANWAYFHVLGIAEIQSANSNAHPNALPVATLAARSFLGEAGVPVLSAAFVISALGAMNGSILSGARVPFAMARDGVFFRGLAHIATNTHVPVRAILIQGALASALALSGTFDQLTDWVVVCAWAFYALCISTLFVFRKRDVGAAASVFRVPGFPYLPLLFIAAAMLLIGNSLWNNPRAGLFGGLIVAAGYPVYRWMKRRQTPKP
jgi:APA family basic amino acid/polyamine antiporter